MVCLEPLLPNQPCRRAPCLHTFHDCCLGEWVAQRPTCPVCKLGLDSPTRELRYRLDDLQSLADCELKYVARYLGAGSEQVGERGDLEVVWEVVEDMS